VAKTVLALLFPPPLSPLRHGNSDESSGGLFSSFSFRRLFDFGLRAGQWRLGTPRRCGLFLFPPLLPQLLRPDLESAKDRLFPLPSVRSLGFRRRASDFVFEDGLVHIHSILGFSLPFPSFLSPGDLLCFVLTRTIAMGMVGFVGNRTPTWSLPPVLPSLTHLSPSCALKHGSRFQIVDFIRGASLLHPMSRLSLTLQGPRS